MRKDLPILSKRNHQDEYNRALDVVEGYMIGIARARGVTTYVAVGEVIAAAVGHRVVGNLYRYLLGDVSERTWASHRVLLSAVVVSGEKLRPGGGFVVLARQLGAADPKESDAECAARLLGTVWKKYSP